MNRRTARARGRGNGRGHGGGRVRLAAVCVASAASLALAACSPLSPGDLPLDGTEPWVCDGVSRGSMDLILGEGYTAWQWGDWRDLDRESFLCQVDGIHGSVEVEVWDLGEGEAADRAAAERLQALRDAGGEAIDNPQGVPGSGYRTGSPDDLASTVTAAWVCSPRALEVRLVGTWQDGTRDARADAANLAQQVLPFACGGEAVPGVDYSPQD